MVRLAGVKIPPTLMGRLENLVEECRAYGEPASARALDQLLRYTDQHTPSEIRDVMVDELHRATQQFSTFASAHEGYAVILEELDELWEAVRAGDQEQQLHEAIQVGAMAMRFVMDCCEVEDGDERE